VFATGAEDYLLKAVFARELLAAIRGEQAPVRRGE
jgi:DNA-binding response OmpR family regulator